MAASTDPRIDAYIEKAPAFAQPVLTHLRAVIRSACPEAEETIKWSRPHFMLDGKILAGMSAFKAHCALHLWQREGLETEQNMEAMGQFGRIERLKDLPTKTELKKQIVAAAELLRAGAKRTMKHEPRPPLQAPADLLAALSTNAKARQTFESFAPSKQRDYVEWILEAKRAETREKRLAQSIEWLSEGKARHWKYEAC